MLNQLIKYKATNIGIWSHTNGSITKYKNKDILNLLKQFDKCKIIMSHDGIGKKGEYVRYGLKQDVWLKIINGLSTRTFKLMYKCVIIFLIVYN